MKLLLVTDTHGKLKIINELVRKTGCDAVVHAGDFGFYDDESVDRLSDREVWLFVKHAALDKEIKDKLLPVSADDRRDYIRKHLPLSDLPLFIKGQEVFEVPVYAVWGNHEDVDVVEEFQKGNYKIENLNILHESVTFHFQGCHLFGLGGNFLVGKKLFQRSLAGGAGKVWSVLSQYQKLMNTVADNTNPEEHKIFVTHVSPGKEPFMSLLAAHLGSCLNISGHMGAPHALSWTEFGIRSLDDATHRLKQSCQDILLAMDEKFGASAENLQRDFLSGLLQLPDNMIHRGREFSPEWYVNMWHVNLPDVVDGYAVLEIEGKERKLTTFPV